jgi:hypothetical protein
MAAQAGPRLELKLKKLKGEQAFGKYWTAENVDVTYRKFLGMLALPTAMSLVHARALAEKRLTVPVMKTFLLWSHGEPREVHGTTKTFENHRKLILSATGADIAQSAVSVLHGPRDVSPSSVFAWDNRVTEEWIDERASFTSDSGSSNL